LEQLTACRAVAVRRSRLLSVTNCVALYTANMLARAGIVN
jgi:hypothetical protein